MDSSQGHAEACPRCGRPAAAGHACGKRAHQNAADPTTPIRKLRDTQERLGSSPTLGAGESDEPQPLKRSLIGHTLGKNYRVLEPIGAGGMGIVYLVEHVVLKKRFAAKVLNSELSSNAEARARFEVEAHAVSQLDHDNVVNVIDYGASEDGLVFLVMEYLRGRTLQSRIDEKPLGKEELLAVMLQVCHALGSAHEAGIVHRDMKPDNIFLNERMRGRPPLVKVLDFGISKARDASLRDGRITKQGQVLGSPEYMSPEAARGDEVDARADIYAVGIILYELITGRVPFRSENYLKVLQKHISEKPVPPRQLVADLAEPMERLILRALAKHPDGRQQSMEELEGELLAAMPEEAELIANPRRTPSGGIWLSTPPAGIPTVPIRPITDPKVEAPAAEAAPEPAAETKPAPAVAAKPAPAVEAPGPAEAADKPARRRRLLIAGGIAASVAVAAISFAVNRSGGQAREKKPDEPVAAGEKPSATPAAIPLPEPPAPVEAAPPPTPTPAPPPAAAPETPRISFRVDSTPRGASVYLNGKLLGKTPLATETEKARRPGQLRLVLRDYAPLVRRVDLSRPLDINVPLTRHAPATKPDNKPPADIGLRENR